MAQRIINTGTADYAGDGESLRDALIKVNDNFTEVYADLAAVQSFDGDYNSLTNKPDLSVYALTANTFNGDYNNLSNLPDLTTLATFNGNLGSVTDVTLTNVTNGQVLTYDSTSSKWVNTTPAAGSVPDFSTLSGVLNIVSGANPDQYMYISTTSGGTTFTNAAFKYSSALSAPVAEFSGPTVLEAIKVGNTVDILYAPTISPDTNPGTSTKIDMTIIAGSDSTSGINGQLNLGTNNTDAINIGTGGIANSINIGDGATTTTIDGNLDLSNATVTGLDTISSIDGGGAATTYLSGDLTIDGGGA